MLSILIVNWNTRDLLRACLFSLREACSHLQYEIVVVDNASHDASAETVRNEFPEVALIENTENRGYAAANNQAFVQTRGEWIWLLNPDTQVMGDAPQRMLDFLQSNASCGGVASALVDASTGETQRSCRTFPTPAALWTEALGLAKAFPRSRRFGFYRMGWWNYRDARRVEQPMASSWMLRREAIENSGGLFDEQFPIFFNDVDLAWRLHRAGWAVWFLPQARVLHFGGASTRQVRPAMIAESHRSLRRFYRKHWAGSMSALWYGATMLMIELAGIARLVASKRRN